MTHIKLTAKHTGDERWVEAGADAWAVHCWALTYCDQQDSDGRISRAMAERIAFPVPPDHAKAAVDTLLSLGLWEEIGLNALQIVDYDTYGLMAEEKGQTRTRWTNDKRRSRKHNNGVHDECDPKRCPAAARLSASDVQSDGAPDNTTDTRSDKSRTPRGVSRSIPDQTLLDSTPRERRGGEGPEGAQVGSAGATPTSGPRVGTGLVPPHDWTAPPDYDRDDDPNCEISEVTPCHQCGALEGHLVHYAHAYQGDVAAGRCTDCDMPFGIEDHTAYDDYLQAKADGMWWPPE